MSKWLEATKKLNDIEKIIKDKLFEYDLEWLNVREVHVLSELYKQDKQHPSHLARKVETPATSFTPTIDHLEGRKLVMRESDPKDRRAVVICLTALGASYRRSITDTLKSVEDIK